MGLGIAKFQANKPSVFGPDTRFVPVQLDTTRTPQAIGLRDTFGAKQRHALIQNPLTGARREAPLSADGNYDLKATVPGEVVPHNPMSAEKTATHRQLDYAFDHEELIRSDLADLSIRINLYLAKPQTNSLAAKDWAFTADQTTSNLRFDAAAGQPVDFTIPTDGQKCDPISHQDSTGLTFVASANEDLKVSLVFDAPTLNKPDQAGNKGKRSTLRLNTPAKIETAVATIPAGGQHRVTLPWPEGMPKDRYNLDGLTLRVERVGKGEGPAELSVDGAINFDYRAQNGNDPLLPYYEAMGRPVAQNPVMAMMQKPGKTFLPKTANPLPKEFYDKITQGLRSDDNQKFAAGLYKAGELTKYVESLGFKEKPLVEFVPDLDVFFEDIVNGYVPTEVQEFGAYHGFQSHSMQIAAMTKDLTPAEKKLFFNFYREMGQNKEEGRTLWHLLIDSSNFDVPESPQYWVRFHDTPKD